MGARAVQGFFCSGGRGLEAIVSGEVEVIRVELKYCEACGALWMRDCSGNARYCSRCRRLMAELSHAGRAIPAEGVEQ